MSKFKVGDRVRRLHFANCVSGYCVEVGDVCTVSAIDASGRLAMKETPALVFGHDPDRYELVYPKRARTKRVKRRLDALEKLLRVKGRRAVLVKVLQQVEARYPADVDMDAEGETGVPELMVSLGEVADAMLDDDCTRAHDALVVLAADCISWLEDAESQPVEPNSL